MRAAIGAEYRRLASNPGFSLLLGFPLDTSIRLPAVIELARQVAMTVTIWFRWRRGHCGLDTLFLSVYSLACGVCGRWAALLQLESHLEERESALAVFGEV